MVDASGDHLVVDGKRLAIGSAFGIVVGSLLARLVLHAGVSPVAMLLALPGLVFVATVVVLVKGLRG